MEIFEFGITIDWSWIENLGTQPLHVIMWHFLVNGGWILFAIALLYGGWLFFKYSNSKRWGGKQTFMFLAIDIPKNNLQTPRAVENIFVALAGAHSPLEWGEKVFEGKYQLGFSFEIVSIDGFVQFIVRTPTHFRNLVEAAIYSQYPDAEITEVEDYTKDINITFPNDEYNIWGSDLGLVNKPYYPIKSYREFQEELDKEFKDPMAALLEVMNKIGPGEQIWFQILVVPANNDWMHGGRKAINKIMGIPEKVTDTAIDKILNAPLKFASTVSEQLTGSPVAEAGQDKDKFDINRLTPIQKREVESIAQKIDKINFDCKVRYCYFGKKEVFKKALGVSGVMGAVKQFTSTGLNALKPDKNKTQARLLGAKYRLARLQNRILAAYKDRNTDTCKGTYILSVEELATLWHFPYIEVKAPLVKTIEAKRGSAPIGLPLESAKPTTADDIPVEKTVQDEGPEPVIDYDNDYFEQRFAIDKTGEADEQRKEKIMGELSQGKDVEDFVDRPDDAPEIDSGMGVEDIIVSQSVDRRQDQDTPRTPEEVEANKPKQEKEEPPVQVTPPDEDNKDSVPSNLPFA